LPDQPSSSRTPKNEEEKKEEDLLKQWIIDKGQLFNIRNIYWKCRMNYRDDSVVLLANPDWTKRFQSLEATLVENKSMVIPIMFKIKLQL